MIHYIIPGMYEQQRLNFAFLKFKQEHPECFYNNFIIESVYGNPQYCIWDGGRIFTQYFYSCKEEIEALIQKYNEFGIHIRYVFTSSALTENEYYNHFGNLLMQLGKDYNSEVVIADAAFADFLHQRYPEYTFISSTTKCLRNPESAKFELNNSFYKMHCLDYNLNKNFEFLKSLLAEEKERTEFLVNAICPPGCTYRKHHYLLNSLDHLSFSKGYEEGKDFKCNISGNTVHPEVRKNHISYEDIVNIYEPMGFSYFKIEGRTLDPLEVLLSYCHYMVKPEYKDWVISEVGLDI